MQLGARAFWPARCWVGICTGEAEALQSSCWCWFCSWERGPSGPLEVRLLHTQAKRKLRGPSFVHLSLGARAFRPARCWVGISAGEAEASRSSYWCWLASGGSCIFDTGRFLTEGAPIEKPHSAHTEESYTALHAAPQQVRSLLQRQEDLHLLHAPHRP